MQTTHPPRRSQQCSRSYRWLSITTICCCRTATMGLVSSLISQGQLCPQTFFKILACDIQHCHVAGASWPRRPCSSSRSPPHPGRLPTPTLSTTSRLAPSTTNNRPLSRLVTKTRSVRRQPPPHWHTEPMDQRSGGRLSRSVYWSAAQAWLSASRRRPGVAVGVSLSRGRRRLVGATVSRITVRSWLSRLPTYTFPAGLTPHQNLAGGTIRAIDPTAATMLTVLAGCR